MDSCPRELEIAISLIEECKRIHDEWIAYQEKTPGWREEGEPEDVGDPDHHRTWSERYSQVLEVLESFREEP